MFKIIKKKKEKKGLSLLSSMIGVFIMMAAVSGIGYMSSKMMETSAKGLRNKSATTDLLENFKNDVRMSEYRKLSENFHGKKIENYLNSGYDIETKVNKFGPCDKDDVCDLSIIYAELKRDGEIIAIQPINRVYTHFVRTEPFLYTGNLVKVPLNKWKDINNILYEAWGAGGGNGGDDAGATGGTGGAGGYVKGKLNKNNNIFIMVGQKGNAGGSNGGSLPGAKPGEYGSGGKGDTTGYIGTSGAGGAGGGRSAIYVNEKEVSTAGGGGGGASNYITGLSGSLKNKQIKIFNGENGVTCPTDGGGGGGGGGGHFGGKGGLNGFDYNFFDSIEYKLTGKSKNGRISEGGAFGGSYNFTFDKNNDGIMEEEFNPTTRCISNEDGSEKVCNPDGIKPGGEDVPSRGKAGSPNEDGKVNIYYEREIWNTI